jgi:hypothetical protein
MPPPSIQSAYTDLLKTDEVCDAFGKRAVPKYAALLSMDGLPDADRVKALESLWMACGEQETKASAVEEGVAGTCAALLESEVLSCLALPCLVFCLCLCLYLALPCLVLALPCLVFCLACDLYSVLCREAHTEGLVLWCALSNNNPHLVLTLTLTLEGAGGASVCRLSAVLSVQNPGRP